MFVKPPQLGFGFAPEGGGQPRRTPKGRKQIRKESYQRHKQTELAGAKKWREAHKEEQRIYNNEYARQHPEAKKQQKKRWRAKYGDEIRSRERIRYESRKAAGMCTQCGKVPPERGHVSCRQCADRTREREIAAIARRGGQRAQHLFKYWRLTPAQWGEMFDAQGGCCAICGTKEPGQRWWQLDHDHGFAKKDRAGHRGILCHWCNKGLGIFCDDYDRLLKAAAYLQKRQLLRVV